MISGAHVVIYSSAPDADREFFRSVLGLQFADAGDGWLIFALPPAELAVHPGEAANPDHELYLMCDDIDATMRTLHDKGVEVEPQVHDQSWGRLGFIRLPGGSRLGIYQPRHARPG
jgi:catechol 2,3-dioxygenase-like lactoylglutathione lyase family enzyme